MKLRDRIICIIKNELGLYAIDDVGIIDDNDFDHIAENAADSILAVLPKQRKDYCDSDCGECGWHVEIDGTEMCEAWDRPCDEVINDRQRH